MKKHLLSGTIKRIHVNQRAIRANIHAACLEPVMTVQHKGKATRCKTVTIQGPSKVVYQPDKPLSCGARLWIETTAQVTIETEDE